MGDRGHGGELGTPAEPRPQVAVVGAGYLGVRIIAELLLLECHVSVYDKGLAEAGKKDGQTELDRRVKAVLSECVVQNNLLELAGMPSLNSQGCGLVNSSGASVAARTCLTVAEAARNAGIVIEAVPDSIALKSAVFAEALSAAPPEVLLATSTLSIALSDLQQEVAGRLRTTWMGNPTSVPRVVGLRFLAPVVFIPFVEVTLTRAQLCGSEQADREDLMNLLSAWDKSAFYCEIRGAADIEDSARQRVQTPEVGRLRAMRLSESRLRLDAETVAMRQIGEAKLRKARQQGPDAMALLTSAELYSFSEDTCCVCMAARPSVRSLLCGHSALCKECADAMAATNPKCPICRKRFVSKIENS